MEKRAIKTNFVEAGNRVSGYAAVFEQETTIQGSRPFREVIARNAFRWGDDVKLLYNHDVNHVLGSTKAGTLAISQDKTGLHFDASLPDSATSIRESLSRGDIDGMSFSFTVNKEGTRSSTRELQDVTVHEISIVTFPAYSGTSVNLRSVPRLRLELAEKELL